MTNAPAYYDKLSAGDCTPLKLLPQVTCPHCWERFPPQEVLWVSEHVDLLGDTFLGPEQQQRFLPSRYTLQGDAIDARGMTCRGLACPRCHLSVPRAMMEMEPLFISILGAEASGKSYFLTAMTWQLRQVLPLHFKLAFTDADMESNQVLNECEQSLFLNPMESEVVSLDSLIPKTDLQGSSTTPSPMDSGRSAIPVPSCLPCSRKRDVPAATRHDCRGCFASTTTRASTFGRVGIPPRAR